MTALFQTKSLGTLGGTLIIAGTSIGAGMLGLPVLTGPSGFFPSLLVLVLCWAFMTATGLLYAELAIRFQDGANILTMAEKTLGKRGGKTFAWLIYLFLFYSLLIAYSVGGGNLLGDLFDGRLASSVTILLFALFFIAIVACGKTIVDPFNKACMIGLFIAFFGFVFLGSSLVDSTLLTHRNWNWAWIAFPIAFTSFGYQGVIPTLASWMHYDARKIRFSIVCGTAITLLIYIIWQALILGIVPVDGSHGLLDTIKEGRDAVHPLHFFTQNRWVAITGMLFAFFAIATSFVGVGISLVDFWADGLKLNKKNPLQMALLLGLAFLPPLIFALFYPHIFLEALGCAGGFGSALLLGALPIFMVLKLSHRVPLLPPLREKWVLIFLLGFIAFEIGCELVHIIMR